MPVDLSCAEAGPPHGPAVVLLHAFPLSAALWDAQREALGGAGYRVLTPDQRGFGDSPLGTDAPGLDRCAEDVDALLDRRGVDRVVLGGLSMGGYVAMAFLRRWPQRVRALVLADTKAADDPPAARENRLRMAAAVAGDPDLVLRDLLPPLLGHSTHRDHPEVVALVGAMAAGASPAAVAWAQRAMAQRPNSRELLAASDVPALLLVGEEDTLTFADLTALYRVMPRAELVTIPASGHLSAVEAPEDVTFALRSFLDGLPD